MVAPRILIAGVGNIFLGDDAFGVEVVRELSQRTLPAGARVVDFGIRGLDLAYTLLDGYETVILVDAVPRGGKPGDVYVIEAETNGTDSSAGTGPAAAGSALIETHSLDPARVLQLVSAMGGRVGKLMVVGCEPVPLDDYEDIQPGLSDAARAAIPIAVEWVMRLVNESNETRKDRCHEIANAHR